MPPALSGSRANEHREPLLGRRTGRVALRLLTLGTHLSRFQLDSQLVELAGETERRLVFFVVYP